MNDDYELNAAISSLYSQNTSEQIKRYTEALNEFKTRYGEGDVAIFRAPGRVNLIGEHTDYNHGYVMPVALDRDTLVLARARSDQQIHLSNLEPEFDMTQFDISPKIPLAGDHHWSNYARGIAQHLPARLPNPMRGADILVAAGEPFGVPRGAGLSSSSSLTVALMLALGQLNHWSGTTSEKVQLASDAEWYVGTRGGIMDHYISIEGQKNRALFLDCRPQESSYQSQTIPLREGYDLLIINSGVKHQNVGGGYNWRVAACRAGVAILKEDFPDMTHLRDVQDHAWEELEPLLPEALTVAELAHRGIDLSDIPTLVPDALLEMRAKCRHVHTENQRVKLAIEAMNNSDMKGLGQLLNQAHKSAKDDYDISCNELELLQGFLQQQTGVLGARLTGAGWGGCVIALTQATRSKQVAEAVKAHYYAETNIDPDVFVCQASQGAGKVADIRL